MTVSKMEKAIKYRSVMKKNNNTLVFWGGPGIMSEKINST